MGKTPKPLRILVDEVLLPWSEMDALEAQGHTVDVMTHETASNSSDAQHAADYDIIFSPKAWLMTAVHKKYHVQALKAARLVKYPPKPKKGKKK